MPDFAIETLTPAAIDTHLDGLGTLLQTCVAAGASVNFILPYSVEDAMRFWTARVRPEVEAGGRVVLLARIGDGVAGSVQLECAPQPNQPHRAEIAKLLVHPDHRRRGIARALMIEIEARARQLGRSLLTLDTASEAAERLYLDLGYRTAGIIPGYARDPVEDRYDATTIMYKAL